MTQSFSPASRALIVTAALIISVTGIKFAAPLIVPFLLALFIAVISFPLVCHLQHKGLTKGVSITLVILLVILVISGLMFFIGNSLNDFSRTLPMYKVKLSAEWGKNILWLNNHGIPIADNVKEILNPSAAMDFISSILKGFSSVLTNMFLIILTVVFMLTESAGFSKKLSTLKKINNDQALPETNDFSQVFVQKLRHYMGIKTIISMITGIIIGSALWLVGVDYAILWGLLAFMLNFIPNIGSIIAAVPAVMLTFIQLGFTSALLVAAIFVMVNIIIGSFIEPKFMGKGLDLSTLVVFVSLVFWGWVLGPVGMLLSVPLTITVKLILDSKPETQWMGGLLANVDD